jgi:hypothetical protein
MYVVHEHAAADGADGLYPRPSHSGVVYAVHQFLRKRLRNGLVPLEPRGVGVRNIIRYDVHPVHLVVHSKPCGV